jgi:hypothetical protein
MNPKRTMPYQHYKNNRVSEIEVTRHGFRVWLRTNKESLANYLTNAGLHRKMKGTFFLSRRR